MPTAKDATVVNKSYGTFSSARPQILSNGWIVTTVFDSTNKIIYVQVDKLDGKGFVPLCNISNASYIMPYFSLCSTGTYIYIALASNNLEIQCYGFDATIITDVNLYANRTNVKLSSVSSDNTALAGVSLVIDETGDLRVAWSSKNSSYPSAFNLRYSKGSVKWDGSVSWNAVQQVTILSGSGNDSLNPSLVVANGVPIITCIYNPSTIRAYILSGSSWVRSDIFSSTYAQSSPSAIFIPQRINGLTNGRIWVAWHGKDSTDSAKNNIRVSYSDDVGSTWSAMEKATNSNVVDSAFPSLTATKTGRPCILYSDITYAYVKKLVYNGVNTWANTSVNSISGVSNFTTSPSALFDLSIDFKDPLFIYMDMGRVGFYGSWDIVNNSVPSGFIGQITSKDILKYSVTSDVAMSPITEKINGITVGTKTATSGQNLSVSLTQAQWDEIKYGKYATVTGGLNTLTVEIGTEKWTYTFDKRFPANADLLSVVRAVQDSQNTYLPAVKSKLASAIRSKGLTVNDGDTFENMATVISKITDKRWASGTVTTDSSGKFTITGLSFAPSLFYAKYNSSLNDQSDFIIYANKGVTNTNFGQNYAARSGFSGSGSNIITVTGNSLSMIQASSYVPPSAPYSWIAFE